MNYCGIDIAMKSSYIYITDSKEHKKTSGEIPTKAGVFRQRLRPYLRGGLAVAIEAGNQTAWIHDLVVDLGAEVTVVNPAKVKLIAESRRKTDKIDGKSITSIIDSDAAPSPHEVFHWETGKHWAIRQGEWKLVHNGPATNYKGRKIPQVENFLSNLAEDVTESRNLAEANPEMVELLTRLHDQWLNGLRK